MTLIFYGIDVRCYYYLPTKHNKKIFINKTPIKFVLQNCSYDVLWQALYNNYDLQYAQRFSIEKRNGCFPLLHYLPFDDRSTQELANLKNFSNFLLEIKFRFTDFEKKLFYSCDPLDLAQNPTINLCPQYSWTTILNTITSETLKIRDLFFEATKTKVEEMHLKLLAPITDNVASTSAASAMKNDFIYYE